MAISSTRLPFFDEKNYLACHCHFYYGIYTTRYIILLTHYNFKKLVSNFNIGKFNTSSPSI